MTPVSETDESQEFELSEDGELIGPGGFLDAIVAVPAVDAPCLSSQHPADQQLWPTSQRSSGNDTQY